MVLYRRNLIPGGTYFFTIALADRRSTALTTNIATLRGAFQAARDEHPFHIDAIVILPDHLHTILTLPEGDARYPSRLRRIKAAFTHKLRKAGAELPTRDQTGYVLWQRRFWEHTIRDQADYDRHIDYIHYNPAKHGHVANPADWPYSSIHRFIRRGILPADWGQSATSPVISAGESA